MFHFVENRLLASGKGLEILNSLFFPIYKFSRENTQPENMLDIVFEKTKVRSGKVSRTSAYAEAADRKVL